MKVLVCGGRDYQDYERLAKVLDDYRIGCLVHGGAKGADSLAGQWAELHGIPVCIFPAQWDYYGKRAGFVRNRAMLVWGRPDLVLAFPGGAGTAMMVKLASEAGVKVIENT